MFNATLTEQRYEPQPHICWDPCWPPHAFGTFVNTVVSDVEKKTRDATCFLGVSSPLPTRWKPHASQLGYRQLFRNHQLDLIFLDPQNHPKFAISIKIIKEFYAFAGSPRWRNWQAHSRNRDTKQILCQEVLEFEAMWERPFLRSRLHHQLICHRHQQQSSLS